MKSKVLGIVCSLVMLLVLIPFGAFQLKANAAEFKGSGTSSDPYQISTEDDLFRLASVINNETKNPNYRYCYYKQMEDIDLENKEFTPIGKFYGENEETTSDALFAGSYDGNYHTINNLNINYYDTYCGLFGRIGQWNYDNSNCIIQNLNINGRVESTKSNVGGIVGEVGYGASVVNCSFNGTVVGLSCVGGCVGNLYCGGRISSCYSNADIVGNNTSSIAGGIVGQISVGNKDVVGSTDAILKSCYFAGSVSAINLGGVCGKTVIATKRENSTITFNKNFYLITENYGKGAVNGEIVEGCTPLNATALKACADMLRSPFVDNDEADGFNDSYPIFEWQSTPYQFKGSGTDDDPYQISSKKELETMRDLVNSTYSNPIYGHACYIQTEDIDLKDDNSWIPIGIGYDDDENGDLGQGEYNYQNRMFYGLYDGNQKNIYNLFVDGEWKQAGLFGYIRGNADGLATVQDLVVYGNINVPNSQNSGGIVGQMQYSATIKNCAFIGDVSGGISTISHGSAGGVAGYIWAGGQIVNSYHNGKVTSEKSAGGITGTIRFGSYNVDGDTSIVENCYHTNGIVYGAAYSGVVVGTCTYYNGIDNKTYVKNCYGSSDSNANALSQNATSDNTMLLPKSLLKKIAEDLGDAYVDNTDNTLNDGCPVFPWQLEQTVSLMGDVNEDGEFNVADVILLQKWLLAVPNTNLANWEAANFCEDDRLDVFDLCLMKRILIKEIETV